MITTTTTQIHLTLSEDEASLILEALSEYKASEEHETLLRELKADLLGALL